MRGCLCDCFGPYPSTSRRRRAGGCCSSAYSDGDDDDLDGPLDQNTINRCLEAVRKHEIEQQQRFTGGCKFASIQNLFDCHFSASQIYHPPPTAPLLQQQEIGDSTAAPVDYPTTITTNHRSYIDRSPPPSYRSTPTTSMERLSGTGDGRNCITQI